MKTRSRSVSSGAMWKGAISGGREAASGPLAELRGGESDDYEIRLKGDVEAVARRLGRAGATVVRTEGDRLTVRAPDGTLALFRAARDAGAQVRELSRVSSTLEDAFLAAVGTGRKA